MRPTDRFGGTGQVDRYATHLPHLVDAVMSTAGAILELGCGHYSTPVLAAIARRQGRRLEVQASDVGWARVISASYGVTVTEVDWDRWNPPAGPWSVCLVDHELHTRDRIRHLPKLVDICEIVVVHDADAAINHAHWAEMIRDYTGMVIHKKVSPWTAVLKGRYAGR